MKELVELVLCILVEQLEIETLLAVFEVGSLDSGVKKFGMFAFALWNRKVKNKL